MLTIFSIGRPHLGHVVENMLDDRDRSGNDARGNRKGARQGFTKKFCVQDNGLARRVDDRIESRAIILVWAGLDDLGYAESMGPGLDCGQSKFDAVNAA